MFLDPKNADALYANLKASVAKLPVNAQETLSPLVGLLVPFINNSTPKLEGALPNYIEAQRAILINNTVPLENSSKRSHTKISKALNEVAAYTNALATFTDSNGDGILNNILVALIKISPTI